MQKPALPTADVFCSAAQAFEEAADSAYKTLSADKYSGFISIPLRFLYFRSIELSLKGFLRQVGVPQKEIVSKLGHKLNHILAAAEAHNLQSCISLTDDERRIIIDHSDFYSNKWFEYPEHLFPPRPDIKTLRRVCKRLGTAIDDMVFGKPRRGPRSKV